MKAMILAAGLGKRMRPLTNHVPKPLLKANDKYLIAYHLENLNRAGIHEALINTHWLGEQLPAALGNGEPWGLSLQYSHETELLETAGGILNMLPMLATDQGSEERLLDEPFLIVNGDVYTELDLQSWISKAPTLNSQHQAHLALVPNPDHNSDGDFCFDRNTQCLSLVEEVTNDDQCGVTYSGIGLFHPSFFAGLTPGPQQLGPLLKKKIGSGHVSGNLLTDYWLDVGTPERLQELETRLAAK